MSVAPDEKDERVEFSYGGGGVPRGLRVLWALFALAALVFLVLWIGPELLRDLQSGG